MMSQRTNKTPRRTPSIDHSEKDFIAHCRLRDIPVDGTVNDISSTTDPDTVFFIYGSKTDRSNELIYKSFKEAITYDTFKKYLYKYLIPCHSRHWGKNGVSYIYKGKTDYTILENSDTEKEDEEESIKEGEALTEIRDAKEIADEEVVQISQDEEVNKPNHEVNEAVETRQQIQRYRKRVHEEEVQPSVSQENITENDADENFTPKRPRIIQSNDETTEKSRFTRSEPAFAPNNSKSPTLCVNTSKRNEQLNFSTPNDSASLSPSEGDKLNASELKEQPIERIKDVFSWLDLKNNSEEKFINEHMFDARSADLELGSLGIDPHEVPSSLISHMNQNLFSLTLNQSSASPILSQSIEIDEEPEEEEITDDESFEISPPKARNSLCCLM